MPDKFPPNKKICCQVDWWLVAVLLVPVIYFLPEFLGLNVFAGIDSSRLNMPFRLFDREAIAAGHLPLWNPYMYAGFPHLAESESGLFYPGNIFIHLPGDFTHWYSIEVVAHFMIAASGFYTWMRYRRHEKLTSAFLAVTYSTTPFLIFHITTLGLFTSIVWLPWFFLIFDKGIYSRQPLRFGLWLSLIFGIMLMSGSIHATFLSITGLVLYGLGKIIASGGRRPRLNLFLRIMPVLVPIILAPVIAAIQILPTLELTQFSERSASDMIEFYDMGTWLNIPRLRSLVTFPALDNPADIQHYGSSLCFLGVIPFIFALSSLAFWKEKRWELLPLVLTGIVTLLLAFGRNLPGYDLLVQIPPFSMFRYPGRMAHVTLTVFLVLAAPGLDYLLGKINNNETRGNRNWWPLMVVGTGIIILTGIYGVVKGGIVQAGSAPVLFFGILVAMFTVALRPVNNELKNKKLAGIILGSLLVLSLAAQVVLTYPFSRLLVQNRPKFDESLQFFDDIRAEFPSDDEIPRVLLAGSHYLMDPEAMDHLGFKALDNVWDNMSGNASGLGNVTALRGLTPLNQNDWKVILRDTLQANMDAVLERAREFGEAKIPDAISMKIILMLGTDILLLEGDDWEVPGFELWRDDLGLPYHDGLCAYRAEGGMIVDAYFVDIAYFNFYDGYAGYLRWLSDEYIDIGTNAGIEMSENGGNETIFYRNGMSNVIGRDRGYNWMTFDVSVDEEGGFLVTGENFYPGWKAFIDGDELEIYKTNYLLMGIEVPAGEHKIEFRYQPGSVLVGMIGSLSGLIIWAILMGLTILISGKRTGMRRI